MRRRAPDDEILPGINELATAARIAIGSCMLLVMVIAGLALQCSSTNDEQLGAEREAQAKVTDAAWQRILAGNREEAAVTQALRDSLAAVRRSAPAVRKAIARSDSARAAIAIGADPTTVASVAGDTVQHVRVRRRGDATEYVTPLFVVDAYALALTALDSAVRQLQRQELVIGLAEQRIALDSLQRARYDTVVASLRREVVLADRAARSAARTGRIKGFREGVIVTALVALIGAVVW